MLDTKIYSEGAFGHVNKKQQEKRGASDLNLFINLVKIIEP